MTCSHLIHLANPLRVDSRTGEPRTVLRGELYATQDCTLPSGFSSDQISDESCLKQTRTIHERKSSKCQELGARLTPELATSCCDLADFDGRPYERKQIVRVDFAPNIVASGVCTFTQASLLLPVAGVMAQLKRLSL